MFASGSLFIRSRIKPPKPLSQVYFVLTQVYSGASQVQAVLSQAYLIPSQVYPGPIRGRAGIEKHT